MSSEGTCTDPYPPAPEEAQKTSVRVKSMFLFNSPTALYSLLSMKVLVHKVACFLITYRWRSEDIFNVYLYIKKQDVKMLFLWTVPVLSSQPAKCQSGEWTLKASSVLCDRVCILDPQT